MIAALLCCAPVDGQDAGERKTFRRGDANDDGVVNVLDALFVRDWQFAGGTVPSCLDAADANGNRRTDLGDPVFVLSYVFACGTPPPAPGPLTCGAAPEGDGPGCLEYDSCDVGGQGQRLPRTTDIKIWVEGPDPSSEPDDLWATVRLRDDSPPGSSGVSGWEIVLRTSCEFNAATAEVTEVGTVLVEDDGHVGDPFIDDVVGTFGGFVLLQFRPDEPFLRRSVDHAVLRFRIVPPPGGSVECDAIFDDSAVNPTCPTRRNFVLVGDELIRPVARGATLTFSRPAELSVDRDTPCEPATVELTPQAPTAIWEVTAPGDANALVLELTSTSDGAGEQREENILLARWGQPPTATSFDHAAASRPSAGQRLVVPLPLERDDALFVSARGMRFPSNRNDVELCARALDAALESLSVGRSAGGGELPAVVHGSGLDDASLTWELRHQRGDARLPVRATRRRSPSETEVSLDLSAADTGGYDLVLLDGTGGDLDRLPDAFEVVAGDRPALLDADIDVRRYIRRSRVRRLTLTVTNFGDRAEPAPLVRLTAPAGTVARLVDEDEGSMRNELLTLAVDPDGVGVIPPGETVRIPVLFRAETDGVGDFRAHVVDARDGGDIDWSSVPCPDDVSPGTWEEVQRAIGATWAELRDTLASAATELAGLGQPTRSVDRLLRFAARGVFEPLELDHVPEIPVSPGDELLTLLAESQIDVISGRDPNKKEADPIPAPGFVVVNGHHGWIDTGQSIEYTIFFENAADARGAEQIVRIDDELDPRLDPGSLRFGEVGFGESHIINLGDPPSSSGSAPPTPSGPDVTGNFAAVTASRRVTVDGCDDGCDIVVQVDARLESSADGTVASWTFRTLDPETGGEPQDDRAGFLPPNGEEGSDEEGRGEGYVTFTITLKDDDGPDIDDLRNDANIVFDRNPRIVTDPPARYSIGAPPAAPRLPRPADGDVDVSAGTSLLWDDDGSGGTTYDVLLRRAGAADDVATATGLEIPVLVPADPLEPGIEYEWRVTAVNRTGSTDGPGWRFRTRSAPRFVRGNANADGDVDISDAISIIAWLFGGETEVPPPCLDAADANDDGETDISDAVWLLSWLFRGGAPPGAPFPDCGEDPIDDDPLDCELFAPCA